MPTVLESIAVFLGNRSTDLTARWSPDMETQVKVVPGTPAEEGRSFTADGFTYWNIRVPKNADSEPEFSDRQLSWPLEKFVEGIGCTGWDWRSRQSRWFAYDFDSITGHAAGVGITPEQLDKVREAALALPWVEVRKSTGGKGLHLYVLARGITTANHTEHAAAARAVLGMMSTHAGFDFASQVDACGGNMWIWHRKMTAANEGLRLIKASERPLDASELPINWRAHVDVVTRKRSRVQIVGASSNFETLATSRKLVPLTDAHHRLMAAIGAAGYSSVWVPDYHVLQTHTCGLAALMDDPTLGIRGLFETLSDGSNPGEPNCFAFPLDDGSWKVNRFHEGAVEHDTWNQDGTDWTWCYFNRTPDLRTAALAMGGGEISNNGGFDFDTAREALEVVRLLGLDFSLSEKFLDRKAILKPNKDGRLVLLIKQLDDERRPAPGWADKRGGWWERVLNVQADERHEPTEHDELVRSTVTPAGENTGLFLRAESHWVRHSASDVKLALKASDVEQSEAEIGAAHLRPWVLICHPFQAEYPGGRQWNLNAPQLACVPVSRSTERRHPHWDRVLSHVGQTLNEPLSRLQWAKDSNIRTGSDYLRAIFAAIIREPFQPTPYLFLWGPENSGKSILWESFELLVTRGVVKADRVLGDSEFNGELEGAILCVVEEKDISRSEHAASRLKDCVTARTLSIRRMKTDPYSRPNSTHWLQCANTQGACPVWPGDSRITSIYVPALTKDIPKSILLEQLKAEAPAFLRTLLDFELPPVLGRLRVPIVETEEKLAQVEHNSPVAAFLKDRCTFDVNSRITKQKLLDAYNVWARVNDQPDLNLVELGRQVSRVAHDKIRRGKTSVDEGRQEAYLGVALVDVVVAA